MTVRVMEGHVLNVLRSLPSNTFQCAATSPPYYGLRDYGLPPQVWGGEQHEHEWGAALAGHRRSGGTAASTLGTASGGHAMSDAARLKSITRSFHDVSESAFCACGAWLGSLGLEPTPSLYVEHLVSVFREVRRTLRPDGVCWVNLGDSYAGSGKGPSESIQPGASQLGRLSGLSDCKPKDLLGMPWMVAFALRADGWYLRAEIIWSKANPMPESVTDRPTKAHETVFLLAKSRTYFYDADAIREEVKSESIERARYSGADGTKWNAERGRNGIKDRACLEFGPNNNPAGRNKRSVWEIATAPFPEAHFATFPPKLVEPMLLAGSRPGDHVLDPFGGAGTTGLVADRLGRDCTLVELNPAYASMARERIASDAPLFVDVA